MSNDITTKTVSINYTNYQVPDYLVIDLCNILMGVKDDKFKPISFAVEEGKSPEQTKMIESAKRDAQGEIDQYRSWWIADRTKVEELEKQIAELKEQLGE